MKTAFSAFIFAFVLFVLNTSAADIFVNPGDNLDSKIEAAGGGDVVIISPGTYGAVQLENKKFSYLNPLVIKSDGTGTVIISAASNTSGQTVEFNNCSYIVLEGVVIEGGLGCLYIKASDHIIIKGNEMLNPGQEGCHIGQSSSYIDIISNHIHNTGTHNSQWGEGIYVGRGSYGSLDFPDNCENIWIENNVVHDCGNGEAINIKGESFHVTIKGNTLYNIAPGTSTQYNQSALTLEGANNSISNSYRLTESRDLWVESNEIYAVSGGYSNWDNGIMFGGIGCYIVNNIIHDCDDRGILGNAYATLDLPIYIFNNTLSSNGQDMYVNRDLSDVHYTDPGVNPNIPQTWYDTSIILVKGVSINNSFITLDPLQTSQLSASVSPADATHKSVSWSSSNTSVAKVSTNGIVRAVWEGSATITATTFDGGFTANCLVSVNPAIDYEDYGISASSIDADNVPLHTRDDDLSTLWSAKGDGEWLKFDMQQTRTVDKLEIAFYIDEVALFWGIIKPTSFDIQISTDDTNWTELYSGSSSGSSLDLETFDFADTEGRYIRIIGHGNSVDDWNSLTEVKINLGAGLGANSQAFDNNEIHLYPNPTIDHSFNIDLSEYSNQDEFEITLLDIAGKVIYKDNITGGQLCQISALQSADLYFVKVQSQEIYFIQKLIVR